MFDFVKIMFDAGMPASMLKPYVGLGAISKEEYKTITGTDYVA